MKPEPFKLFSMVRYFFFLLLTWEFLEIVRDEYRYIDIVEI